MFKQLSAFITDRYPRWNPISRNFKKFCSVFTEKRVSVKTKQERQVQAATGILPLFDLCLLIMETEFSRIPAWLLGGFLWKPLESWGSLLPFCNSYSAGDNRVPSFLWAIIGTRRYSIDGNEKEMKTRWDINVFNLKMVLMSQGGKKWIPGIKF